MIARRPLGRSPAGECQHGAILSALMVLMLAAPAGAIITDVEPSNDTVSTAPSQFIKTGDLTIDGGDLELVAGDIDFIGMAALSSGVVVSVTTTPLDDVDLKVLDTMMGLFDSSATEPTHMILCRVDDAPNNDLITSGGGRRRLYSGVVRSAASGSPRPATTTWE